MTTPPMKNVDLMKFIPYFHTGIKIFKSDFWLFRASLSEKFKENSGIMIDHFDCKIVLGEQNNACSSEDTEEFCWEK